SDGSRSKTLNPKRRADASQRLVIDCEHCHAVQLRTHFKLAWPMTHSIISTIVIGLVLALPFGIVAHRLRLPPLLGSVLAGIGVGRLPPGCAVDAGVASALAEIGVVLLMFGVGLRFSLEGLLSVRGIAVSGAAAQVLFASPLALALGWWQGWTPAAGVT